MQPWDASRQGLGVAEMDATHAEFVGLINLLCDCDDTDFTGLFDKLVEHTRLHFTNEGRLMRISRFPALNEHESEHHRIYADLIQIQRAVRRGRLLLPRAFVKQGLAEWFELHLGSMDAALAAHLKRTGESRVVMSGGLPVLG